MGAGKTTIGRKVAERLGLDFIDMDAYIESRYHKSVVQIFSELGEDKFRELEHSSLLEVAEYENVLVATGGGAPCFFDNMRVMNEKGSTVYIRLTPEELCVRLKTDGIGKRPILARYKGSNLEKFIAGALKEREPFYNQAE